MPEIEVLAQGFGIGGPEARISLCAITLIRGEKTTLVDVGYQSRRVLVVDRLKELGLTLADIDRVVLTHGHWDHTLNATMFPNAEVMISQTEYDYVQHPSPLDPATPLYLPDILKRAKQLTTVRDGDELEPGVRILSVPGHSPGSLAVLVETPNGVAGMVGDSLPSRNAAMAPVPSAGLVFFDEEEAEKSARKILDACTFVYPGHDRAFRKEGGSFHYMHPQEIVLGGLPRDEDGTIHARLDETAPVFTVTVQPSGRRKGQ